MEGPADSRDRRRGPLFRSRRLHERSRRQERRQRALLAVLGVVLLAVLGSGGWWLWHRAHAQTAADTTPRAAADQPVDTPAAAVAEEPIDLPELDASDELVRRSVAALSSRPEWAAWLVTDDMVRRFVVAVVAVAEGRSPEAQLRFLVPDRRFAATQSGDRTVVDPESFHRYDVATATFASLDTQGLARLFRQMHPLIEDAYRELGLRDRTFDQTLAVALGNLLTAGVPDTPLDVQPEGGIWVFSAPGIESLSPAEKHLLRMGPENAHRFQAKLREIADALGVTP